VNAPSLPHPALFRRPAEQAELCQLVGNWSGKVPIGGALVEMKWDGMRALYIDGELCSREGSQIHGVDHILAKIREIEREACVPLFIDGEFVVGGTFRETVSHFKAAGGRGDRGTFHVFDMIPMRTWRGEDPSETLQARRAKLDALVTPFVGNEVQLVPWAYMQDAAEIERRAAELIAAGGEGVVVKAALSTYRRTKSANWQRIRKTLTLDVPIAGFYPLRENADALGSIEGVLDGVRFKVAAGFSDAERVELWRVRESLVGSYMEVRAMEVTEVGKPRQAVWVRLRDDKGKVRL
jgi:ATP-dependent DNA ligase